MGKIASVAAHSTRISASILLFVFWLTFIMLFTLFFSPALEQLQNFLIMFTSLLFFTLGVVYVWTPVLDRVQATEQRRRRTVKRRRR
jgi:antibiotic biosynthesis monooxygenase (ABM) superfamily enzyme